MLFLKKRNSKVFKLFKKEVSMETIGIIVIVFCIVIVIVGLAFLKGAKFFPPDDSVGEEKGR